MTAVTRFSVGRISNRSQNRDGSQIRPIMAAAGGFTLLEVLLAAVLSVTLLGLLWALFSVYLRLFETAPAQASQVQLARALLEQLSDDLHAAIEDSRGDVPMPGAAGGATAVRRFGLLGTEHTLRLDVLEVVPPDRGPSLQGDVADRLRGVKVRQVPELRTVFYTFRPPDVLGRSDALSGTDSAAAAETDLNASLRPGLTRRELDYETPFAELNDSAAGGRLPGIVTLAADVAEEEISTDSLPHETAGPDLEDDSITWVPEVVGLKFRYFDGTGFSSRWDSLQRKSLPAAVEVTLQLRLPQQPKADRPAGHEPDAPDGLDDGPDLDQTLDDVEKGRLGPEQVPSSVVRLLVRLPSAQRASGIKRPARAAATFASPPQPLAPRPMAPRRLAVPGPLLIRPPAGASPAQRKPDQWIRTGP